MYIYNLVFLDRIPKTHTELAKMFFEVDGDLDIACEMISESVNVTTGIVIPPSLTGKVYSDGNVISPTARELLFFLGLIFYDNMIIPEYDTIFRIFRKMAGTLGRSQSAIENYQVLPGLYDVEDYMRYLDAEAAEDMDIFLSSHVGYKKAIVLFKANEHSPDMAQQVLARSKFYDNVINLSVKALETEIEG